MASVIKKTISVENHSFRLEIYPGREKSERVSWEIYPEDYKASLYALEHKQSLSNLVKEKYLK